MEMTFFQNNDYYLIGAKDFLRVWCEAIERSEKIKIQIHSYYHWQTYFIYIGTYLYIVSLPILKEAFLKRLNWFWNNVA